MSERNDDRAGKARVDGAPPAPTTTKDPVESAPTFAGLLPDTPTAPWLVPSRPGHKTPPMAPGLLLAGRFRLVRFLGQGGMGDVYEAEDLEVGERLAIKMLRAEIAQDERAIERFRIELALARRVTHPNVCRIFDVFRHQPAAPESGPELTLISMELLPGETLADRIHRSGPLAAAEAMPIVKQMAAALEAAHRAGVIHRDFKSSNVILVPSPVPGQPPRAVVTDFGLAQGIAAGEGADASAGSAHPSEILGTPAYMAPEQVSGGPITPAADVYALGVVMYEMATGSCPFQADTPHITALKRLSEPVISPRVRVPGLDTRWEAVILRCLERDLPRRFARPAEVLLALEPAPAPTTSRRAAIAFGLGLGVLALLGLWAIRSERSPEAFHIAANVQVTSSAGLDLNPALSPDGKSLAFASDRSGSFEIYVRSLADLAGRETALTHDGQQNFQPAWSPDGTRIAYHSKQQNGIWSVAAAGGEPVRLTSFGSRPAWSPDGSTLAFQSAPLVDFAANAFPASAPSTLWSVPTAGGEPRRLTLEGQPAGAHGSPSWTPDGRRIVFGSFERLAASLWSVSAAGGAPVNVLEHRRYIYDPVCSPEGDAIYYAALLPGGSYGMWRVPFSMATGQATGEPAALGSLGAGIGRHPSLARDGKHIAYSALALVSNLWAVRMSGGGHGTAGAPRGLTTGTARANRPAFSPDGSHIAFDRWQPGTNPDVWVMDREGHDAAPVTTDRDVDTTPSFLPDGQGIAFLRTRNGRAEPWSVGVKGGDESPLAKLDQDVQFLRLSPDGKRMAFDAKGEQGGTRIWLAAADGSGVRALTAEADGLSYPVWSPDGSRLATQGRRGEDVDVMLLPLDSGVPTRLTSVAGQSWAYGWTPDGTSVLFAALRGGLWSIRSIAASGGEERALVAEERLGVYLRYPTLSPQGDLLVYERAETTGNVWMMEIAR
jgi:Tol biopolymer transport system component